MGLDKRHAGETARMPDEVAPGWQQRVSNRRERAFRDWKKQELK